MSRKHTTSAIFCAIAAALLLPSCGEKSEAQKAEEERGGVREEKRKFAAETYRRYVKEYPDDPKAAEAKRKAEGLEAMAPKK